MKNYILDSGILTDKTTNAYSTLYYIIPNLENIEKATNDAFYEINCHDELGNEDYTSIKSNIEDIEEYMNKYKTFGAVTRGAGQINGSGYNYNYDISNQYHSSTVGYGDSSSGGFIGEYQEVVDDVFYNAQVDTLKKLRDSKLKDITVANDVGVKSEVPMSMFALSVKKKLDDKNEINLEDLLNFGRVSKAMTKEYETMKEDIDKINEELPENEKISSYNDYVKKLIDSTEFNYESQGEKELSIALDFIPYVNVGKWSYEIIFGEDPVSGKKLSTKERLFTLGTIGVGHLLGDIYKGIKAGIASKAEDVSIDTAKEGTVLSINGVGSGRNIIQDAAKNVTEKILGEDSVKVVDDTIANDGKNIAKGATDDITKVTDDSTDIINNKLKPENSAEDLANDAENSASKVDEVKNKNTDDKQIDNYAAVEGSGEAVPIVNVSENAKASVKDGDVGFGETSGEGIETSYVKSIGDLKNIDKFRSSALKHILEGEINGNDMAVGYHYEKFPTSKGKIINGTKSAPNDLGVYTGKVEIDGKIKKAKSSFFPEEWSAQDVVDAINEAYNNKQFIKGSKNTFRGKSAGGLKIEMYIDNNGNIISAFPKY